MYLVCVLGPKSQLAGLAIGQGCADVTNLL